MVAGSAPPERTLPIDAAASEMRADLVAGDGVRRIR
jgi:hypothetical protein